MNLLKKIFASAPSPELSAEAKVLRAIALLDERKVSSNLTQLLGQYLRNFGQVVVERVENYQAKPDSPLAGKNIQSCTTFTINNRKLDLLLVDVHTQFDDPSLHQADLFVIHEGECVLCIGAIEARDMGGSKGWAASVHALRMTDGLSTNLKVMKVGAWMDDLTAIVRQLEAQRTRDKNERDDRQRQSLEKLARDINLGDR